MFLLLSLHAHAVVPTWTWPTGQPVRYHIETAILTPRGLFLKAKQNTDARASSVQLVVNAECVSTPVGKNFEVLCSLPWVGMSGEGYTDAEADNMERVSAEWSTDLRAARIAMFFSADGRLKEFDLKGLKAENSRVRDIQEDQRILLMRAFSLFDFPLATNPDDWKRGWEQKGASPIWNLITQRGTVGAGSFTHKPIGESDGLYSINTDGRAVVSSGDALDASSGGRPVDIRVIGSTQIDVSRGLMAWRDLTIEGRLTASSSEAGSDVEFGQVSAIQLVDAFPPDGAAPPSLAAIRAPKVDNAPPELPPGLSLVPFADLGMQALFVPDMPPGAGDLPTGKMYARVFVGADGAPTSVGVYRGFAALVEPCRLALLGARFPVRGAAYAVDLEVEYRNPRPVGP